MQSTASSIVTGLRADGREILGGDLAPDHRTLIERTAAATTHFVEMRTMACLPDDGTPVPLAAALPTHREGG